jgi:hypothetical protein
MSHHAFTTSERIELQETSPLKEEISVLGIDMALVHECPDRC